MTEAGKEERRLAIEAGEYHQGVPAITVILDAGWSKRSHKHSYNARSGAGIIIGARTNKILYLGVRNKYCTGCILEARKAATEETGTSNKHHHTCYRNYDPSQSSSSMEPDIILEGFRRAEKMHGVRYLRFIGELEVLMT